MAGVVPIEVTNAPDFNDDEIAQQRSEDRRLFNELLQTRSDDTETMPKASKDSSSDTASLSPTASDNQMARGATKPSMKHLVSPSTMLNHLLRASVKPGTWIYCTDTVGRLYIGIKSSGAFQHASFLSGGRISSAGSIGIKNGQLIYLAPLSGHYRPSTKSFKVFINNLKDQGVDLSQTRVSHAFEILQGMEVCGKSKKGVKKAFKVGKADHGQPPQSPDLAGKLHVKMDDLSATTLIDQNWDQQQRRRGLSHLLGNMSIRSRSSDRRRDDS